MEIDWEYKLVGAALNFVFKTTIPQISLINAENEETHFRFVHKVAGNGLFVSKQISTPEELQDVFNGNFEQDIKGVRITGRQIFFQRNMKITFYEMPRNFLY
jgi:hypothetical protein